MRIGITGGVPPALGVGGLHLLIERTAAALSGAGHEVVRIERAPADEHWDVLHGFGAEPNLWHALRNWTRQPSPLVLSPVLVVSPGWEERLAVQLARVPVLTGARMRRELLARAGAVLAQTEYEAGVLRRIRGGAGGGPIHVVGNAVDPLPGGAPPAELPDGDWAILVGVVGRRKRTREMVAALAAGGIPPVVAGAWGGDDGDEDEFAASVARAGGVWTGALEAPALRATLRRARVLVHLATAEAQSLAVLEALAEGTPAVLSDLPSHREHAAAHPDLVRLVRRAADVPAAIASLPERAACAPAPIPTWEDVGARLGAIYAELA